MALWIWETHWALSDQKVHSMLVSVEEWWYSYNHLKDENTKSPPINCEIMTIADQHLWCQIFGSSTERIRQFTLLNKLGKAKVCNK